MLIGSALLFILIISPFFAFAAYRRIQSLQRRLDKIERSITLWQATQPVSAAQTQQEEVASTFEPSQAAYADKKSDIDPVTVHHVRTHSAQEGQPVQEMQVSPSTEPSLQHQEPLANEQEPDFTHQPDPETKLDHEPSDWWTHWVAHFKQKWLVWVGGLAMLIGFSYLIQFIGGHYTLPPWLRVLIASVTSLAIVTLGEVSHRRLLKLPQAFLNKVSDEYIPATFYAVGLTGLYSTILYATVGFDLLPTPVALTLMAMVSLASLWLSLRLGIVMVALGLLGGFSAPLWLQSADPQYHLLTLYLLGISSAGFALSHALTARWINAAVTTGLGVWLLLLVTGMPNTELVEWSLWVLPISCYLLVVVPTHGWSPSYLNRCRYLTTWRHPALASVFLMFIGFVLHSRMEVSNSWIAISLYWLPLLMLLMPMLKQGLSKREHFITTGISLVMIANATIHLLSLTHISNSLILALSGAMITLACARTLLQYAWGDRSELAYFAVLVTGPLMIVGSLLTFEQQFPDLLWVWSLFAMALAFGLVWASQQLNLLQTELNTGFHVILASISYCLADGSILTLLWSTQVALIALQLHFRWFPPYAQLLKVILCFLTLRMTLVPFDIELQSQLVSTGSQLALGLLPSLGLLVCATRLVKPRFSELSEWLEIATLHLGSLYVFSQVNAWVANSSSLLAFNFYSLCLFVTQGLILFSIYQVKSRRSATLKHWYHWYSLICIALSGLCAFLLNTWYNPLLQTHVTGNDWPIINWLTAGWLVPALTLGVILHKKLSPKDIPSLVLSSVAAALSTFWVILSIRQFWQDGSLTLQMPTSMAELFSYSVAFIIIGASATLYSVQSQQHQLQKVGLSILAITVCKVFLWDASVLEGIWRAISFLALGAALIALGWLFQRLKLGQRLESQPDQ